MALAKEDMNTSVWLHSPQELGGHVIQNGFVTFKIKVYCFSIVVFSGP